MPKMPKKSKAAVIERIGDVAKDPDEPPYLSGDRSPGFKASDTDNAAATAGEDKPVVDTTHSGAAALSESPFAVLGTITEMPNRHLPSATSASDLFRSPEPRVKSKRENFDSPHALSGNPSRSVAEAVPKSIANEEVLAKVQSVKAGVSRSVAETLTVADIYLMMGMPDKVVLEYEWVELVKQADVLNFRELTNLLRRLVGLARTHSLDAPKSRSVTAMQGDTAAAAACISCGASSTNTPPNAKRNRRAPKSSTPKTTRESSEQWDATASPVVAPASGQTQVCFMVTRVWIQPFEI